MTHTTCAFLCPGMLVLALLSGPAVADTTAPTAVTKKTKTTYRPAPPPTIEISAGASHDTRTLGVSAENPSGVTQYSRVPHDSVAFTAAIYPLHVEHARGIVSSFGVSLGYSHSVRGDLTFDSGEQISTSEISQSAFDIAAHHRLTAGRVFLDSHLGIGKTSYALNDAPATLEVPDTKVTYAAAGARLGVDVFRGVTVGAGAKLLRVLGGNGELTNMDWYGPGRSSGHAFEASLTVPLPAGLFVRAKAAAQIITTELDGAGVITEMEGVTETKETTFSTGLAIGIRR